MKTLMLLLLLGTSTCFAAEQEVLTGLPKVDDVLVIAIKPQPKEWPNYFTSESLLKALLPSLRPADVRLPAGKKRAWQSGVIVLKDKSVLFWRTCGDWFIAIDRSEGTTYYALK